MKLKRFVAMFVITIFLLSGCGNTTTQNETTDDTNAVGEEAVNQIGNNEESTDDSKSDESQGEINLGLVGDYSDKAIAAEWTEEESTLIQLSDDKITIDGTGALEDGAIIQITEQGTYVLSGSISNAQVLVDLEEDENVQLVLNGVEISCDFSAPIMAVNAKNVFITLAERTENVINDHRVFIESEDSEVESEMEIPTAAIYSKTDLMLNGIGELTVNGNYKDGITSKDDLEIIDGNYIVYAVDDGIVGKDSISVRTGDIEIHADGDGMKSSNKDNLDKGYIVIDGGDIILYSGDDGMDSIHALVINGGNVLVEESVEGLESLNVVINDGFVSVVSSDDGINISDGTTSNTTTEATNMLPTDQGAIPPSEQTLREPPAGQEPPSGGLEIRGDMPPTSSETTGDRPPRGDFKEQKNRQEFTFDDNHKGGGMEQAINGTLYINGGTVMVDAGGDGLDSNGNIVITGGITTVSGSENQGDGALDANGNFDVTGGTLFATGMAKMAVLPNDSSKVQTIYTSYNNQIPRGTIVKLINDQDEVLYEFTANKHFDFVSITGEKIESGKTYQIIAGSTSVEVTSE